MPRRDFSPALNRTSRVTLRTSPYPPWVSRRAWCAWSPITKTRGKNTQHISYTPKTQRRLTHCYTYLSVYRIVYIFVIITSGCTMRYYGPLIDIIIVSHPEPLTTQTFLLFISIDITIGLYKSIITTDYYEM